MKLRKLGQLDYENNFVLLKYLKNLVRKTAFPTSESELIVNLIKSI